MKKLVVFGAVDYVLVDKRLPLARCVCGFRHPIFSCGEGLEWRGPLLNVYP